MLKVRLSLLLLVVGSVVCNSIQAQNTTAGTQVETVVFLVRHAEKQAGKDPDLTASGQERAANLAKILAPANIEYIHTSAYARTKQTALPTSVALEIDPRIYDAHDLEALVDSIHKAGGRHLVVGHSNTIPKTVALLGGEPGHVIKEHQYDRLYLITIIPGQAAATVMLHY